jgi:glutaredoxin
MQSPDFTRGFTQPSNRWARTLLIVLGANVCLTLVCAQAQTVYRSVDANGRVTFSDQPPAKLTSKATPIDNAAATAPSSGVTLPFELRQVAGKYPVILYTSANCAPCEGGRRYLMTRGVPFAEKTVSTQQDVEAFRGLSGSTTLPFLTIGGQHVSGYSSSEWTQYLSAAGYPERSKLPATYVAPPAAALVPPPTPVPAEQAKPAQEAAQAPETPAPSKNSSDNPAGIQF